MGRRRILGFFRRLWLGFGKQELRSSFSIPQGTSGHAIPDLAASIFNPESAKDIFVSCASFRGLGHEITNMARQDSYTAFTTKDFLVVAIADGVSSSTNSHFGAQLVTRELQSVFSEYISKENVGMSSSWMGLNQQLSKQLVRVHANNLKIAGQPIPDSLNQLREAAADSLATTLEILVVELQKNSDSSSNYIYVNIAGDGSLYQLHEGLIHELNPDKSEVFALPASDKEPLILSGKMSPNTALALCTDGIGAYILKDQSWAEMMIEVASESRPTYAKLIDFITFRSPGALDDQTIILTSFK